MIERVRNYRISEEIGSGGMAVVFRGTQESLNRTVAIKALKTSVAEDENLVARFEREALSVASFQHENIISLYDFFRERGALFMIMEYVEGIDLYDLLERSPIIPTDVAAIVALQVARALDYAHFRGVVHRDVKPANVMLSKLGEVKLMDFGIARVEQSDLTQHGIGLGTPAYMSPEQIIGDHLDHRTDLWSLGVVLYQMVAGRKPFYEEDDRTVMQRIRTEEPPQPRKVNPAIDKDIERIILKCMKKKPGDRFGSAQELVISLEQYLATRVAHNYRARLVLFLREHEIVSSDESIATLHPALIGAGRQASIRVARRRPRFLSTILLFLALAFGLAGGIVVAPLLRSSASAFSSSRTPKTVVVKPAPAPGQLNVLVRPWAHVEINGVQRETTPHPPIPLAPGRYRVRLTNPYGFTPVEEVVEIQSGKQRTLEVALRRETPGGDQ
ncbi:MAG: serine/threonine protein kinase [Deltaproteobacteria bacterium]|nr:serine/threonine protein kinase [Deltaproteobacteria bacterium]